MAISLPISALLLSLLILRQPLIKRFGASFVYALWLLVPLTVFMYWLPMPWHVTAINPGIVETMVIQPSKQLQQHINIFSAMSLWSIGCITLICWLVYNNLKFIKSLALQPIDAHIAEKIPAHWPKLSMSEQVKSPMLIGLLQQKIVLPSQFQNMYDAKQQQLVLAHEYCHFKRHDILWNLLAISLVSVFWFNPLVWVAYFKFRQDQELSCDQQVLAREHLDCRIKYSKALLVAADHCPTLSFAQLSFIKNGDKIMMIERINHIQRNINAGKLGIGVAVLLSLGFLSSVSYAGNAGEAKTPQAVKSTKAVKSDQAVKKVKAVKPVMRVEPVYPAKAAKNKISGAIVLKFDIGTDGSTQNIEVINAEPKKVFDKAAKDALAQWKYQASDTPTIGNLVQLDFLLNEQDTKPTMVEQIKVTQ